MADGKDELVQKAKLAEQASFFSTFNEQFDSKIN